MDSSTGTFTSMDTYGGSLSDPMSLHKYLFANANPIMNCDSSGHESTLIEQVEVCGIISMLCNATIFWIDVAVHPENEHTDTDYIKTLIGGFVTGIIGGAIGIPLSGARLSTFSGTIIFGVIIFLGLLGYWTEKIGKLIIEVSDIPEVDFFGEILIIFGSGLKVPLMNVFSFDNEFIGFLLDVYDYIFA